MKRRQNNNTHSSNHQVNTLESLWSKRQKANEVTSSTATASNGVTSSTATAPNASIPIASEIQIASIPSSSDKGELVVDNIRSPSDLSISADHPPARPILSSYPSNHENRSFQSQWYHNRPWLEYSIAYDSAYCYNCRHFGQAIETKRLQNDAFTTGFNGWRRSLEKDRGFDQHVKSTLHIIATRNFNEYTQRLQSNTCVLELLDKSRAEAIKQNRAKLMKICSTVLFCARQMIALRGHEEDQE